MDTRIIKNAYHITKWAEIVKQCRTSGQTISTWCKENHVNEKSYYYWQKRVREAASSAASNAIGLPAETTNPFVPIELPLETSNQHVNSYAPDVAVTLQLNSMTISIHNNATPSIIETIMKAIHNAG